MSKPFLKTTKFHIETILFWPLIYLLWEPFSKKRSHWWNWSKYNKEIINGLLIKGREGNKTRNNLWDKLILTNFSWKECVVLRPKNYEGEYQVGYVSLYKGGSVSELCSVVLDNDVACLLSEDDTTFYAVSYPNGKSLELEVVGYRDKFKLDNNVTLI